MDQKEDSLVDRKINTNWSTLIVGLILGLFTFGFITMSVTLTQYSFYVLKTNNFPNETIGYSHNQKSNCETNLIEMEQVEKEIAVWNVYCNIAIGSTSLISVMLINSFSDKIGRRKAFVFPIFATLISNILCSLVIFFDISIYYLPIIWVLDGVGGGLVGVAHIAYAYIADTFVAGKPRTFALVIMDVCVCTGTLIAQLISGYMIKWTGYLISMVTSVSSIAILPCLVLILPETVPTTTVKPLQYIKNVFDFYLRPELTEKRWKFVICMIVYSLASASFLGRISVQTIYELSSPFCWDSVRIGWFAGFGLLVLACGMASVKILQKGFSDEMICLLGTVTSAGSCVLEALAYNDLMLYMVPVAGIFAIVTQPVIKGIVSKMTPMEKQGTMFGGMAAVGIATKSLAAMSTNYIYQSTLSTYRGIVFFVLSGCDTISAVLVLILYIGSRTDSNTQENTHLVPKSKENRKST